MQTPPISLKAKFSLVIAITLWASAFVAIRAGLRGYSPGSLALLRYLIASSCMLPFYVRSFFFNYALGALLCIYY